MSTLGTILKDNWEWRSQIWQLAIFELKKKSRGTALSWAWLFVHPAMYIFCFWFALEIGLRLGRTLNSDAPYFLWLCAGIIPWFFMSDMIGKGADTFHSHSYLVTKVKFPLSAIPTMYLSASMIIHVAFIGVLFVIYFLCGQPLDIHLLQVPLILLFMIVFWEMFCILFSLVCGMAKDVANLLSSISTPIFWLSGVIFNIDDIGIGWVQTILWLNPVTFFCKAYRCAFYYRTWVWDDLMLCAGFGIVFVGTFILMLIAYRRLNREVADVL